MENYIVNIGFKVEKHCCNCPLKETEDSCALQVCKNFNSWEEQMRECPLINAKQNVLLKK